MMRTVKLGVLAVLILAATAGQSKADLIDFQSYPQFTPLSSVDGVGLSTYGGPGPAGAPMTGLGQYGFEGLTNSSNFATSGFSNGYPTSNILDFSFSTPVSNVSFTFNNEGNSGSFFDAFDSHGHLLETGLIGNTEGGLVSLAATGISDLQLNNDTLGNSSWIFGVASIQFTPAAATPEPASITMLVSGFFAAGGFGLYRRRRSAGSGTAC